MTRGIITIATGNYKEMALACLRTTLQHTYLPVLIIHEGDNRDIKTRLFDITPFDETIFLDADSVIKMPGINKMFELLQDADFVANEWGVYDYGNSIYRIYQQAFDMFNVEGPVKIYNGALFAFKKNTATKALFDRWNTYWDLFGRQREMPPLACAIHNTIGLSVASLPKGFFEDKNLSPSCVVQHYCPAFAAKYNTPKKQKPPFQQNNHYFWEKVKWLK
jgi:hypothetical protein